MATCAERRSFELTSRKHPDLAHFALHDEEPRRLDERTAEVGVNSRASMSANNNSIEASDYKPAKSKSTDDGRRLRGRGGKR